MGACAYCFSPANIEHMYSLHLEDEWGLLFCRAICKHAYRPT